MTKNIKMDAEQVLKHLRVAHPPDRWFFFEELRLGGGFGKDSVQRVDAFAINYLPSKKNTVRCFEVKVSKSDFKVEINKPAKRRAGMRLSNEFWFICPQGIISIDEVPLNCGLIEVLEDGTLKELVHAPYRESIPTWLIVSSMLRSLNKEKLKEWTLIQDYIEKDRLLQYHSLKVLKKRIKELREFKSGNKEIPDKIAEQMELAYHEIINIVENKLFEEEEDL